MNDLSISQCSAVLNEVVEQATGQKVITDIANPGAFASVATTLLKVGRDPVINALSQMWSKTIFSVRNYSAPLSSLEMDLPRFGNALRKLSPIARQMVDDESYMYPVTYDAAQSPPNGDGKSVDQWKISKQEALQTNFYGTAPYEQVFTIFKDQFDTAFTSADEFARFNAMNMTERNNDKESFREAVSRAMQCNFIGAILDEGQSDRVIHLLTEYNAATGLNLTAQSVYQPANFAPFMKWVYARVKTLGRMFRERSQKFQTVIDGKPVLRFTEPDNLRIALYAPAMDMMEAAVLADTFHDNYLKYATYEAVNFWQSIETPDSIAVTPVYTHTDGTVKQGAKVEQAGIFGIIHDRDALGYSIMNSWSAVTPLNVRGGYWNEAYHASMKTIQDNTEKAVVLLLD